MFREESGRESRNAASAAPTITAAAAAADPAGTPRLLQGGHERLTGAIGGALRTAPANRRNLIITSLPLALFALVCVVSFVARAAAPGAAGLDRRTFGKTTRAEATTIARSVLHEMTGETPEAVEVSTQTAFAHRRAETVREWNVLFDTPGGRYLLRLNAETGTVYAVNRLNVGSRPRDTGGAGVSRRQAETRARAYLGLLGVPTRELTLLPEANRLMPDPGHPARRRVSGSAGAGGDADANAEGYDDGTGLYNFTYRRPVPGLGSRLLKISVNRANASLEHVWNPVSAL